MCKIIKGNEASEMMSATLDEMKIRKLLDALQKTKDVIEQNNHVVSEALDRMINALNSELEAINELMNYHVSNRGENGNDKNENKFS